MPLRRGCQALYLSMALDLLQVHDKLGHVYAKGRHSSKGLILGPGSWNTPPGGPSQTLDLLHNYFLVSLRPLPFDGAPSSRIDGMTEDDSMSKTIDYSST